MTEEVWKPISGFEGLYEVSNFGRVRSLTRFATNGRLFEGQLLNTADNGTGYRVVNLHKDGKQKMILVHRLVAQAFIKNENPEKKHQINHIDGDKTNNAVSNLEWCSWKENMDHAYKTHLMSHPWVRPVICVELDMMFSSTRLAEVFFGIRGARIGNCCKLLRGAKTCAGFHWKYADEVEK